MDGLLTLLTPQAATDPTACAEGVIAAAENAHKPILASWMGQALVESGRIDGDQAVAVSLKPNELAQALRGRS